MPLKFNPFTNNFDIVTNSSGPGSNYEPSVVVATTADLNAVYDNGSSGEGATLTNNGALAAILIDGVNPDIDDRILVKDQTNQFENGIYTVTVVGDGSTAWILTRATNYDSPAEINPGDVVPVVGGTTNANSLWDQQEEVNIIGTDSIIFLEFTGSGGTVTGPILSTDNALVRWDGITGTIIQNSLGILDDAGQLSGLTRLDVDNIRIDGNIISSTNANGDIFLTPAGTGTLRIGTYFINQNGNFANQTAGYSVTNVNTTATSQARIQIIVGAGTDNDPWLNFGVSGVQDYSIGIDNSDSDALVISPNSTLNGSNIFRLTNVGALSAITQLDVDNIRVDGNTISSTDTNGNINLFPNGSGIVELGRTLVGSPVLLSVDNNDNTDTASHARISIRSGGTSGGNPYIDWGVPGLISFAAGVDASDGLFKLTNSNTFVGSGSILISMSSSGVGVVNGSWQVDNIRIDANTISSTDTNGNIILAPNGTGINRLTSNSVLQTKNVVGALYHQIDNGSTTAGAYAYHEVRSRPEPNGQSYYSATITATRSYAWGVDDNDSQVYKFTTGVSSSDLQSSTELYRITPSGDITFASTGFMKLPTGTTAQRPGSPVEGMIRGNTSNHNLDYYNGTQWQGLSNIELLLYQAVSSVADVRFDVVGNTKYKIVCFYTRPVTNTDTLLMEVSTDGGSTWQTTGYVSGLNYFAYNSTTYSNSNSTANAPIMGPSSNASSNLSAFDMQFYPVGSNVKTWNGNSRWSDTTLATQAIGTFGGAFSTGAVNAIRFRYSTGNISACQIALYRYNV